MVDRFLNWVSESGTLTLAEPLPANVLTDDLSLVPDYIWERIYERALINGYEPPAQMEPGYRSGVNFARLALAAGGSISITKAPSKEQ